MSRDQLEEGDARPRDEAGDMATNNDARADAAAGLGGGYREDASMSAIGDLRPQGVDQG